MKVRAREIDWEQVPGEVRPFALEQQTELTPGREYVVCSVAVYKHISFLLVIDDLQTPKFMPAWLFSVTSGDVPADWICSVCLGEEVELVLGPSFVAKDLESYVAMVDQEWAKTEELWRYRSTLETNE